MAEIVDLEVLTNITNFEIMCTLLKKSLEKRD